MSDDKENRDIKLKTEKDLSKDKKSDVFSFLRKDKNKDQELAFQNRNILVEQKEVLENEKKKKKKALVTDSFKKKVNETTKKIAKAKEIENKEMIKEFAQEEKKEGEKKEEKKEEKKGEKKEEKKDKPLTPMDKVKEVINKFRKNVDSKNDYSSSNILKTNLIQGEITVDFDWGKNIIPILFSVFISTLVIGVGFIGLLIWEDMSISRGTELIDETNDLIVLIKKAENKAEDVDIFQRKIGLVEQLLENHIYWTNFFEFLEKNTLTNAYYNNGFNGDIKGDYSFVVITDKYSSITDFVNVLDNNENVIKIDSSSAKINVEKSEEDASGDLASFQLSLTLNPELFRK